MKLIPKREDPGYHELTQFIESPFAQIQSNDLFLVQMQYPLMNLKNAESRCMVRKEVYDRLREAASALPEGYRLKILDAWRPFALQVELYEVYSKDIIRIFELEDCPEEQQKAVIRKFVSDPDPNREVPPVHTTGGAVDVTIIDKSGKELTMGSLFDEFSDRTYTAFYENGKNKEIRDNRRLLYGVMTSAGFTNLPSEWWHYDYGDRFWGFYNKLPSIYNGVFEI